MGDWSIIAVMGAATAIASALVMPLAMRLALRTGITDKPASGKVHSSPTPYLGGAAIMVTALVASPFLPHWEIRAGVILGAASLVACIGLVDDIRSLGPAPRLLVEIVAACAVCGAGARAHVFGGLLDWALTVCWLVVITNSFNLLDNMDGCAGLIVTMTAIALAVAAGLQGQVLVGGLAAILAGACLGFLAHNWHPARIFMGDAGSLFVGFLLSTVALLLRFPVPHRASIAAVLLLAGPALFDTTLVVISRLRAGRPIYVGGTDHTSHRLVRLGLPITLVAPALAVPTVLCCVLGVAVGQGTLPVWGVVVPGAATGAILLGLFLRIPVYADGAGREQPRTTTPGGEQVLLRRAAS